MKKFASFFLAMVLVLGMAGCYLAAWQYKQDPPLPQTEGTLQVSGLRGPVEIFRDQWGIPHITTPDEHDLFFAVGYVQAQDRLWEMALLRAVSEGRLSELFGSIGASNEKMDDFVLSTMGMDKHQRLMGINWMGEAGQALLAEKDPAIHAQLSAYVDGINAFIDSHPDYKDLPVEFQVLRVKPERFQVANVISLGRFIGSMLGANMDKELFRYAMTKKYGQDLTWQIAPLHYAPGPTIVPKEMLKNRLAQPRDLPPGGRPSNEELGFVPDYDADIDADAALEIMIADVAFKQALYVKAPYASNNWIIGPRLSENGNAILANDPHLAHIEPSLFYMMHINGGGIDAYGVTFPGNPYTVLGHTRKLAWGATTTSADVQDLYLETVNPDNPGQYLYKGEWLDFTVREETIKVKNGRDVKLKIRQTVHGPIINGMGRRLDEDDPPVAFRWTGWDFDRNVEVFHALVTSATVPEFMAKVRDLPEESLVIRNEARMCDILMRGDSIDDFIEAMDMIMLPNQSWIAADADGHIAYLPGGAVPVRKKGIGVMPVPGHSGEFDWTGFIPLMELPHAIDPERGYMATANNEVVDSEWYPHVFTVNFGDGWRAWRIEEMIAELAPLSVDDVIKIQNDVKVKEAEWMMPFIRSAMEKKNPDCRLAQEAFEELAAWDFFADLDATAPVIYYQFKKELARNTFEDEMPEKDYKKFLGGGQGQNLARFMEQGGSPFFDDKRTDEIEDMGDMIVRSLTDAMKWVKKNVGPDPEDREWGKVHYIKWYHPLGWGLLDDMSVGPFPHIGGDDTVRNAGFAGFGKDPYKALGGPVLRHVMDMGNPDSALMVIDGSQSGQWLSPHYRDMHQLWLHSEYVTADMNMERIKQNAAHKLTLAP